MNENKSAFEIINESLELVGGMAYLTEKIPDKFNQDNSPAGKDISRIEDKIYCADIAAVATHVTATMISVTVQPNQTIIFTGLAGEDLDGFDITIKDGDGNVIYDGLPGELVGSNIYEWVFKCPHVMTAGKTYVIEAYNRTSGSLTPILTARAVRLTY